MKYNNILNLIILSLCLFGCKSDDEAVDNCDNTPFPESVYEVIDTDLGAIHDMIQTTDNDFITLGDGRIPGPSFNFQLTKLSAQLEVDWTMNYGGFDNDFSSALLPTLDGGLLMCGSTRSFGQGSTNVYVVKANEEGQEEWSRFYGSNNAEKGIAVLQLEDESYIIVGYAVLNNSSSTDEYIIRIDKEGNEIWSQANSYSFKDQAIDIQKTSDGHIVILSTNISSNGMDVDLVVAKLDYDGNTIWRQNFGTASGSIISHNMINTSDNQLLIAASTAENAGLSSTDFLLIKLNEAGETQWTNTFGSPERETFKSVIEVSDEGFLILGDTPPCNGGRSDIQLSKVNSSGDLQWQKSYGGEAYEASNKVLELNPDEFLIAGHIEGSDSNQDFDLIMFKVDKDGEPK